MAHSSVLETYYLTLELVNSNFFKKNFTSIPNCCHNRWAKKRTERSLSPVISYVANQNNYHHLKGCFPCWNQNLVNCLRLNFFFFRLKSYPNPFTKIIQCFFFLWRGKRANAHRTALFHFLKVLFIDWFLIRVWFLSIVCSHFSWIFFPACNKENFYGCIICLSYYTNKFFKVIFSFSVFFIYFLNTSQCI